jgi:hypothetical protein
MRADFCRRGWSKREGWSPQPQGVAPVVWDHDDKHKDEIMRAEFRPNANVEIGRFKGSAK